MSGLSKSSGRRGSTPPQPGRQQLKPTEQPSDTIEDLLKAAKTSLSDAIRRAGLSEDPLGWALAWHFDMITIMSKIHQAERSALLEAEKCREAHLASMRSVIADVDRARSKRPAPTVTWPNCGLLIASSLIVGLQVVELARFAAWSHQDNAGDTLNLTDAVGSGIISADTRNKWLQLLRLNSPNQILRACQLPTLAFRTTDGRAGCYAPLVMEPGIADASQNPEFTVKPTPSEMPPWATR